MLRSRSTHLFRAPRKLVTAGLRIEPTLVVGLKAPVGTRKLELDSLTSLRAPCGPSRHGCS